jgi:serine/threonine protein kinase/Tfp pilus assembly protein PilF
MSFRVAVDEQLMSRLPLPLAQLYRRAHNAKNPLDRHLVGYYLWEAALKLLGAVAVVSYAESGDTDGDLAEALRTLTRPSLGHWWEYVRRLTPVLADQGDPGFAAVRDLVMGRTRDDLPRVAGLDAALLELLDGQGGARSTVRLTELFDRLVRYRNRELGHGAAGQQTPAHYESMSRALLAGVPQLLERLDVLAGRRLLFVSDVRRQASGLWLVERYELHGETMRRLESLELTDAQAADRLVPERIYLERPAAEGPELCSLHPLLRFDPEAREVLYLNARRGHQRVEYLSYSSGRVVEYAGVAGERCELLARVLKAPVSQAEAEAWAERSRAEDGPVETGVAMPRRLGEFELLSELGHGGMGVVYRAWQPSLGRQVAVKKLFQTGDPRAEKRFAREIRALGRVEHPHLVKVFTSGSDGEHWFYAMELVEGATLADICERLHGSSRPDTVDGPVWQAAVSTACEQARRAEKPLCATERGAGSQPSPPPSPSPATSHQPPATLNYVRQVVELVRQVAEAAHALHEAGVVHRDIKPGNILVNAAGTEAVLMDLGLAQVADEVAGKLTRTRQFVGTLRYASPEQVLAVRQLDRRSDVYSLGATLWELLTLRPLFGATDEMPTPDLMEKIQREDVARPRQYHPGLSRDLEAIVLKCLEKDPGRRYATAGDLVRDLERYQRGEPVQARPVGRLQRGWRWCRRNPAWASMLGALALVIAGSLAGLTVLYLNARHREAGARAIAKFYEDHVLAAARPGGWEGGAGRNLTIKEALDLAGPKIDEAFPGQPELEAAVRNTLGVTYWGLGEFERANPHLEKAYKIRSEVLGGDNPDTLKSQFNLARQRSRQYRPDEALALARQAWDKQRRVLGPEHIDTLWTQAYLGFFLLDEDQRDEAESILRHVIETSKRTQGPGHVITFLAQNDLAFVLEAQGKLKERVEMDRETLEGRRHWLGPDHPDTLRSLCNLASALQAVDELEEAETLCRQSLEGRRRVLGNQHNETYWSLWALASILESRGKVAEAEECYRQTLRDCQRLRGPDDPDTVYSLVCLGRFLRAQGKLDEAGQLLGSAVNLSRRKLGPEGPYTLSWQCELAWLLHSQGKTKESEDLYRQTLAVQRRVRGPEHEDTLTTLNNLAKILSVQGKNAEAETLFNELVEVYRRKLGADDPGTLFAQRNLAGILWDEGKWTEAEELYQWVFAAYQRLNGADHADSLDTQSRLANLLRDEGRLEEAEKLHRQILDTRRRVRGAEHPDFLESQHNLALVLQDQGNLKEAEKLLRQTLEGERKVHGPENPSTLLTQTRLASVLGEEGKEEEAAKLFREALDVQRKNLPPDHLDLADTLIDFGYQLTKHGGLSEAELLLREGLSIREKKLVGGSWRIANAQSILGVCLARQKMFDKAEPLLLASYEDLTRDKGTPVKWIPKACDRVIELYEKWGKPEQAEAWRKKLPTKQKDIPGR